MVLAARCGLAVLLAERLRIATKAGANAMVKVMSLVARMVAGADSITDVDLLRHGAMSRLLTDVRAPSALGTSLRAFTSGHVRQLDAVAAGRLARLAAATPILAGADQIAFVDLDDTVRQTYGDAKQGTGRVYTGVDGLNLLAVLLAPPAAPVIAAIRLRQGVTNSVRGAAKLLADALATAQRCGVGGGKNRLVIVRARGLDILRLRQSSTPAAAPGPGSPSSPPATARR